MHDKLIHKIAKAVQSAWRTYEGNAQAFLRYLDHAGTDGNDLLHSHLEPILAGWVDIGDPVADIGAAVRAILAESVSTPTEPVAVTYEAVKKKAVSEAMPREFTPDLRPTGDAEHFVREALKALGTWDGYVTHPVDAKAATALATDKLGKALAIFNAARKSPVVDPGG